MSEALTPEAPVDEPAVPSVEDQAPGEAAAVASGSAGGEELVPASRFNGLMSKMQKLQSEWDARQAEYEAKLEALQAPREETPDVSDSAADEVRLLREELAAMRAESARSKVLEKYPEAAAFADLIVGDTVEDIEAVAKALAERVSALRTPAAGTESEPAPEAAPTTDPGTDGIIGTPDDKPAAPVVPGGQSYDDSMSAESRVADAIARNDFPAYLRAKSEAAMSELG